MSSMKHDVQLDIKLDTKLDMNPFFCMYKKNGQGTFELMYFLGWAFLGTGRGGPAGVRRDAPRLSRKVKKTIGKTMFRDIGKTTSQKLIKP